MNILAIETSCDETAIAILTRKGNRCTLHAHQVASQIALHTQYGGVFPMMAKREHSRNIVPLFLETLKEAGVLSESKKSSEWKPRIVAKITKLLEREPEMLELFQKEITRLQKPKIDRITVTVGPGLEPALWVGINFAKALSYVWNIPLVPVNHMEGHILSIFPEESKIEFTISKIGTPAISLLVSGGHTELVLVKGVGKYAVVGKTLDDAAGEAFDKVARMLGLPYPGGPEISRLAESVRADITSGKIKKTITLPRPMLHSDNLDFSFSGLKTAVLYLIKKIGELNEATKKEIACEFENSAVEVLVAKTMKAVKKYKAKSVIVGGGVSANKHLRKVLTEACKEYGVAVIFPTRTLTTDNAIMIGIAGSFGKKVRRTSKKLLASGNMSL